MFLKPVKKKLDEVKNGPIEEVPDTPKTAKDDDDLVPKNDQSPLQIVPCTGDIKEVNHHIRDSQSENFVG